MTEKTKAATKPEDVGQAKPLETIPTTEPTDTEVVSIPISQFKGKDSAYFVRLPDGSVVSARGAFPFSAPGDYVIDTTTYTVPGDNSKTTDEK
jgi:hypothetical protein